MGFVDFTPKKLALVEDMIAQVKSACGVDVIPRQIEKYIDSNSREISLYMADYKEQYRAAVEKIGSEFNTVIINTPMVSKNIELTRRRPNSFYEAINESNLFNRSINNADIIELPVFDLKMTYDGVHYTKFGNDLIFEKVREFL